MGVKRLDTFRKRLETLPLNAFVADALEKHDKEITQLVKDQLIEGVRGDGKDMARYKSQKYATFKKRRGSKSSPKADLKLTGKYHKSIKQKVFKDKAEIFADDNKHKFLKKRYGNPILDILEKRQRINPIIIPDIRIDIRKFMFNG